jgi:hypothetical protein
MLPETTTYCVLLLPHREVAARGLTLNDADAWVHTYNSATGAQPYRAVIAEEQRTMLKRPAA